MKRNGKPYLVDIETLGEALALSRARTYDLVQRGVLPRASRGRYDLVACVRAYVEWVREERGDADALALRRLKRERAELELGIRRKEALRGSGEELVTVSAAVAIFSEAVTAFWPTIIGLSARIAPRLANMPDPRRVFAILDDELRATLAEAHKAGVRKFREDGERAA